MRSPFRGRVRIGDNSSLRKLMRAARRGLLPSERLGIIKRAIDNARVRADKYLNSSPAKRRSRTQ